MKMNSNDSVILPRPVGGNPILFWDNKDSAPGARLTVEVNKLYIHERLQPEKQAQKLLSEIKAKTKKQEQQTLFDSSNELSSKEPFILSYIHSDNWNNRLILGDSLLVMASLIKRDNLAGKVQTIYFDPPYGINFNKSVKLSNSRKQAAQTQLNDEFFPEIQRQNIL